MFWKLAGPEVQVRDLGVFPLTPIPDQYIVLESRGEPYKASECSSSEEEQLPKPRRIKSPSF